MSLFRMKVVAETGSTNDDLKLLAEAGEPANLALRARAQTGGRGRQGRVWQSPVGNLYLSLLLRPGSQARQIGFYSFVTALAIYDTITQILPQGDVRLKWPNDVLVGGKKISGILIEAAAAEDQRVPWLVVGLGINVTDFPDTALYPATSLKAEGAVVTAEAVAELFLEAFARQQQAFVQGGFPPIRQAWMEKAQKGTLRVHSGNETVEGTFVDLDADGRLILQLADRGIRRISCGDVLF